MRAVRLKELEEMVAKLLVAAGKLPAVQNRHIALKETGRFRARMLVRDGPNCPERVT